MLSQAIEYDARAMPRYELVDGTSSKFWEIEKTKGDTYTVRWGRIGSAGQTQQKKLAGAQYEKLVNEKLRKGYALAGGRPKARTAAGAGAKSAKPTKAKPVASNAKLEETLCEAIDDDERWLVYADWLQQQDDVRGQIIALNLAKKKPAAKKLAAANVDMLWGNAKHLLEPSPFSKIMWKPPWERAKPEPLEVAFTHTLGKEGLVESIMLSGGDEDGHVANAIYALLTAPIGRFVRTIAIEGANGESYCGASGQPNTEQVIAAIARAKPTALRSLSISPGSYQLSWTHTGKLGALWKVTPYLERLSIEMGSVDLGKDIDLPSLRSLSIETGGLDRKNLQAIAKAKWPSLTELTLYLGRKEYGGNAKRADVAALLAQPSKFPKLTSLALCNAEIQGDVVREIVKSPLLKQLTTLDLSKGTLVDGEVAPILENLAAFKRLKKLDLSSNYLTEAHERALKKSIGKAYEGGDTRYDEMVEAQTEYANEDWARGHTFRYTVIGE